MLKCVRCDHRAVDVRRAVRAGTVESCLSGESELSPTALHLSAEPAAPPSASPDHGGGTRPVSYTHLTLPTICSV
eukprot:2731325-Prymnesium_polylepis.1